jgi:uncharacterized membrane protein
VNAPKRHFAVIAYLVPVLGWLYVLLFQKKDRFASYHAKQSMMLAVAAVAAPLIWAVAAWLLVWVPLLGSVIAAALFALVILAYLSLAALWVAGIVYAVQAKAKPLPVIGGWVERIS